LLLSILKLRIEKRFFTNEETYNRLRYSSSARINPVGIGTVFAYESEWLPRRHWASPSANSWWK